MNSTALENHLVNEGLVNSDQLRAAAASRTDPRESLIVALVRTHGVDPIAVAEAIAQVSGVPMVAACEWPKDLPLRNSVSTHFLSDNVFLPLRETEDGSLMVAVADPSQTNALGLLQLAVRKPLQLRVASYPDIVAAMAKLSRAAANDDAPEAHGAPAAETQDFEHLDDLALEAPVIDLVNRLLLDAALKRATDLHIEHRRTQIVLRQRVDGLLQDAGTLNLNLGRAAISRVKIISGLNISERRVPQDGQARVRINDRDYDLRVVTLPTMYGESMAIRLLSTVAELPEIGHLGFSARDERILRAGLKAANGLIVVTGPTGSGKTTTLAACLNHLNQPQHKLVTIEDPVEYQIEGVNQVQVKPDIGITFTSALRSLLRYDPDIMMIGEIRDAETAHIAVHAALTGHLVLTSLHTNSAAGAATRLLDMGVEGYLLASSLRCVVAQRLVRRLCRHCRVRTRVQLDLPALMIAGSQYVPGSTIEMWKPIGCERCNETGYLGRLPIFEVLESNSAFQRGVASGVTTAEIHDMAMRDGMTSMAVDGLGKCCDGETTMDEVARVVLNS